MTARATISFEDDNFRFLEQCAGKNRSDFINRLLRDERKRQLEKGILKANQEESEDEDYQIELSDWDITLSDGLNNDSTTSQSA
jgi:Arc/MetJ-type ribon-helix-helix transcriptional regulator